MANFSVLLFIVNLAVDGIIVSCADNASGSSASSSSSSEEQAEELFLTRFDTEDYDCWSKTQIINWEKYRREFFDVVKKRRSS